MPYKKRSFRIPGRLNSYAADIKQSSRYRHVPMATNPDIKNVLVIGAGDGGTVRELTRYASIERIDMVEIDKMVVDACREFLPQTSCRLSDPRVSIFYEDGLKFVRDKVDQYDLIIVDSTDPFGPGEGLFTKEFYGNCFKALTADGILVNQHATVSCPKSSALAIATALALSLSDEVGLRPSSFM